VEFILLTNWVTRVSNATIISYYTNPPYGSPIGGAAVLVVKTNYTPVFENVYDYQFLNVFTNHYGMGYEELETVTVSAPEGSPYGSGVITNATVEKIPVMVGDFFVWASFGNSFCAPEFLLQYGTIPTILAVTNLVSVAATNSAASSTNYTIATNFSSSTYLITFFTNYSYEINPVTCSTTNGGAGNYQGIGKIQFVYVPYSNYDTATGLFYEPETNNYTMVLENAGLQVQQIQGVATQPDIVFSSDDLISELNGEPVVYALQRNVTFDQNHILKNAFGSLAGPGTITSPTTIAWNRSGPAYYNTPSSGLVGDPYFLYLPESDTSDEFYAYYFVLGSFDGSTNDPVVFPNGTSIANLEAQTLITISPLSLPGGTVNEAYSTVQYSASGGPLSGTLSWSASGLPPGMSLSSTGSLSGTPTEVGTYEVAVTVTDANNLSVQYDYVIIILP
jgi:hypothetical protein